jgi:DNA repair exonuclease SbcCD ATPase subunit
MYVERVRLEHFGCHPELAAEFAPGLNLVIGPNGAGKSTLFHAILCALTEKHGTTRGGMSVWESWGTEGYGPTVELNLVRGDGRYRLRKTFLHRPSCQLERLDPAERLAGKPAEARLEAWIEADGAAGLLMRALWTDHDATALLHDGRLGRQVCSPAAALQPLIESSDIEASAGPFTRLQEVTRAAFSQRFTPERQQFRRGSTLQLAQDRLRRALTAHREAEQQALALAAALDALAAAAAQRSLAENELARRRREVASLRDRAETYRLRAKEVESAREAWRQAERTHSELAAAEEALTRAARDESSARDALEVAKQAAAQAEAAHDEARRAVEDASALRDRIETHLGELELDIARLGTLDDASTQTQQARQAFQAAERAAADAARLRSETATAHDDALAEVKRLQDARTAAERAAALGRERARLAAIDLGLAAIAALEGDGAALPVPDEATRSRLDALARELETLEHALDDQPVALRIVPENDLDVKASDGVEEAMHTLRSGLTASFDVGEFLILEVPGLGRIEIARTGRKAEERRERKRTLAATLDAALGEWGVASLGDLDRRIDLSRRLREEQRALEAHLGGETVDAVRARVGELERDAAEAGPTHWEPFNAGALQAAELAASRAEQKAREAESALIAAQERLKHARQELDRHERALAERAGGDAQAAESDLRSRIAAALSAVRDCGEEIEAANRNALTACRRRMEQEIARRNRLLSEAAEARDHARASLAAAVTEHRLRTERLDELRRASPEDEAARREALGRAHQALLLARARHDERAAGLPPDPSLELAAAETAAAAAESAANAAVEAFHLCEREVAASQGRDLEGRRARAREELAAAESHYEREARDAAAWALLHGLCVEAESTMARSVAARLAELAREPVGRLTARQVEGVELGADALEPIQARARQISAAFGVDRFSRGTREQIALGCRLALGELLAREGRQMLLLDEPLAHTDAGRQVAALELLEELAERLQIVIFTCHPDRYGVAPERARPGVVDLGRRSAPGG